jgi:DNA-binding IclR family transcriptional regulator
MEYDAVSVDGDKKYRLGPGMFYLGAAFARSSPAYRAAWPDLVSVAGEAKLSAAIAVPWDNHHLVIAVHQNPGSRLGVAIGSRIPIDAGSYGKAYYAWSNTHVPKKITSFTPKTIADHSAYAREVAMVKSHGFATDIEEFVGDIAAVAVGITSNNGYVGLCALMGSVTQLKDAGIERAGKMLAHVGERASTLLGDHTRESLWHEPAESSFT